MRQREQDLQASLLAVNQAGGGLGNDELLRLLREWATQREQHHKAAEQEKLASTEVELDSKLLAALILKLIQVEKSLKQLRRLRRR